MLPCKIVSKMNDTHSVEITGKIGDKIIYSLRWKNFYKLSHGTLWIYTKTGIWWIMTRLSILQ